MVWWGHPFGGAPSPILAGAPSPILRQDSYESLLWVASVSFWLPEDGDPISRVFHLPDGEKHINLLKQRIGIGRVLASNI